MEEWVPYRLLRDADYGDLKAGETVYLFTLPTYGCIGYSGIAVSRTPGQYPFFEVHFDNVEPVGVAS